ncbi:hypothetical protein NDU88_000200 [Pleurodeles waltl]|uniref:KRAB domain-containing protein n=1 Tax=Pleurodeles waltl TaxID=8319 RepID=A0AAV7VVS7_PLEWA|nr:hypothetical protein NDU88_000200 [Pleurodeles waltl]
MPPLNSDKVTFQDVAACFSEEEWKLLHEWQKELYTNVMKEIHQALASLGPLIAASVFSLSTKEKDDVCPMDYRSPARRHNNDHSPSPLIAASVFSLSTKEKDDVCPMDYRSPERRHNNDHSPSDAIISGEVLFRTKIEETQRQNSAQDKGRVRNECFSTGYSFHNPNICLRKEEELSTSLKGSNPGAEEGENCVSPSSDFPFLNTDLCLRKEGGSDLRTLNFPGTAAVELRSETMPEHGSIPEVLPIHIKEEEEIYSDNHQGTAIIGRTNSPTGVARTNRQKKVEEHIHGIKELDKHTGTDMKGQ